MNIGERTIRSNEATEINHWPVRVDHCSSVGVAGHGRPSAEHVVEMLPAFTPIFRIH